MTGGRRPRCAAPRTTTGCTTGHPPARRPRTSSAGPSRSNPVIGRRRHRQPPRQCRFRPAPPARPCPAGPRTPSRGRRCRPWSAAGTGRAGSRTVPAVPASVSRDKGVVGQPGHPDQGVELALGAEQQGVGRGRRSRGRPRPGCTGPGGSSRRRARATDSTSRARPDGAQRRGAGPRSSAAGVVGDGALTGRSGPGRPAAVADRAGSQHGGRLVGALVVLAAGVAVGHDAGAGLHRGPPVGGDRMVRMAMAVSRLPEKSRYPTTPP